MALKVRQLEAFKAVMISGSVTGASELLNISQPAVSQLIAQLEANCGFLLFIRTGNRIGPSPEASLLFSEVEQMFTGVSKVERAAAAIRDLRWGELSIAAFPAMVSRWLPELLARFSGNRPDIRITLESRRPRTLVDWVASQKVDFGIGMLRSDRQEVVCELLCDCAGVCILPVGHKLADLATIRAGDLANEQFISLGREDGSRTIIDRVFDEANIPRKIQIESAQSEAACSFVAQGAGVSVVDPFSVYGLAENFHLAVREFQPEVRFKVWLLSPRGKTRSQLAEQFRLLLIDKLGKSDFSRTPVERVEHP